MTRGVQTLNITLPDGAVTPVSQRGSGPRILFTHGSGFASAAFAPFLDALAAEAEVLAFDLRGHGVGPAIAVADYSLPLLISDFAPLVAGINAALGPAPLVGVFHSIGGVFALRAQVDSQLFAGMVCYEPPVGGANDDYPVFDKHRQILAERTLRRRSHFDSIDDLAARYQRAGVTGDNAAAARVLATAMLKPSADGGFELRCKPAIEAKTYATNSDFGLWADFRRIGCPGLILAGGAGAYPANAAAKVAKATGFEFVRRDDLGHSGWMEDPDWGAQQVLGAVSGFV